MPRFDSTTPPRQKHAYAFRAREKDMQLSSGMAFLDKGYNRVREQNMPLTLLANNTSYVLVIMLVINLPSFMS
jgi:hypothetical protein